jgi:hypothetical protein
MNPVSPSQIQGRADIEIGSSIEEQGVHGKLFEHYVRETERYPGKSAR